LIRNQFPPESFTALAPSFIQYNQTSLEGERRGEERRGDERRGEERRERENHPFASLVHTYLTLFIYLST
jgi:hypothetical protein